MLSRPTTTRFTQTEPSTSWVITHNGNGYPVLDVYVDSEGEVQKILPNAVIFVNENTVEVKFSIPRSGFATVIV